MKMRFALVAAPLALAGLGACTTYGSYGYGYTDYGYYDDYVDGYGYGYGPYSGGSTVIWHDAYYDNFYGPVFGGYWDLDGFFWYQTRLNGPYLRDHGRHFRRDYWGGARHYRYRDDRHHGGGWNAPDRDRNTYPPLFSGQRDDRDWSRDNDRGRDGRDGDRPRGNPPPPRGNDDRDRNSPPPLFGGQQPPPRANPPPQARDGARNNDRGRGDDRARGNDDRGRNTPPPLFSGQPNAPRANPPAQPRNDDRGRGDGARPGGGSPPPSLFGGQQPPPSANPPSPRQPQRQSGPPPQARDAPRNGDDSRHNRGRGGESRRDED